MKVAVLGAGNSGLSAAGHFAMLGHEVRLFKNGEFSSEDERLRNELGINLKGCISGRGILACYTGSMAEAVCGSDLIVTAFPAFCRDAFFEKLVPILEDGQLVLVMPDNYGSKVLIKLLNKRGMAERVMVAGANTCIYACRKLDYNKVVIKGLKKNVLIYTNGPIESVCSMLNSITQVFVPCKSFEQVVLSNINCIIHVPAALMNTGWIEHTKGQFDFYGEGITPSVSKVIDMADRERMSVGKRMNVSLSGIIDSVYKNYGIKFDTVYEALSNSLVHSGASSPSSMDNRYITEDVPYGLVPISDYGRQIGVATPTIDMLINLAGIVMS